MRTETEWIETVEAGWNVVAGADHKKIVDAAISFKPSVQRPELYGDGRAAERIVEILVNNCLEFSEYCERRNNCQK